MRRDLRLLPVAGGAWSVALVCVLVPAATGWCALIGAVTAVVVCGVMLRRRQRSASLLGLVLVTFAVAAAVSVTVMSALPARESAASWDGRVVEATGTVTSSSSVGRDGRLWMEVQLGGIGPPGVVGAASAPVRIGIDPADGFDLGATVSVTGEGAATEPGERTALVVFATDAEILRPARGVFGIAADARQAFIDRSLRLPEPGAGLLPGLAVGDTRAVTPDLNDDMRTSGLSHLTAVSGANCAIVVGAVFWLTALCGGGRKLRVLLAATALAGFVVLVTPEPSVIRAGVMAGVAMVTVLLGRPSAGAGLLALCAVAILLVDPWLAATPGFALSVAASGALILLAPPLARGLSRMMPGPLALAIAVPLAAQLACGPIIALFAEQQSLVGVAANLLAAPAAPIATVLGLLGCLAAPLPPLADLFAASAWLPAAWIATTATTTAGLPAAELVLPAGIGSALLVLVVSAAVATLLLRPKVESLSISRRWVRLAQGSATAIVIVVLSLGAARVIFSGPLAAATAPDGWAVAACDVGQGDAVLVRSAGVVALFDTGPDPKPLAECLQSLGIGRIDLLVLSHFDLDHVGGTSAVYGKVEKVLHGPVEGDSAARLLDDLSENGAALTEASAGLHGTLGSAAWRVFWPIRNSAAFPVGNDASVVVSVEGGGVPRSLFLGDLSAAPQRMLLREARLRPYSVVKVAHHGSVDQDSGLYEAIHAAAALVSVGVDNEYGHPRDETLDLLTSTGAHILRTDQQGRVLIGETDGALQVWTERR
ncbi:MULTISPECIES: ComEC/Rec2 family competence protein [unclassified Microbacterium]|uniref:ComEC/Rec2 family competence protein n=1 Tax=unclassified Microbacterium TaxID=2609290 RepID=UPI00217D3330|nr:MULTISPECIES: ComEC/Rec2 family competence protein [unclassified Microbacterium]